MTTDAPAAEPVPVAEPAPRNPVVEESAAFNRLALGVFIAVALPCILAMALVGAGLVIVLAGGSPSAEPRIESLVLPAAAIVVRILLALGTLVTVWGVGATVAALRRRPPHFRPIPTLAAASALLGRAPDDPERRSVVTAAFASTLARAMALLAVAALVAPYLGVSALGPWLVAFLDFRLGGIPVAALMALMAISAAFRSRAALRLVDPQATILRRPPAE